MTHEAGWEITIESLVAKGPEGRDAIRASIKELEDAGYLLRERQKTDGKFGAMDYVLQVPPAVAIPSVGFSDVGKTDVGKTYVGESATKNTIFEEHHMEENHVEEQWGAKAPGKRSRATSFPADFALTDEMRTWAESTAPGIDLGFETEKFKDYHQSKGSTFKDWEAAWRTWMRNAVEFKKPALAAPLREGTWW
ncbi:MAG TPA: hypothetical protein VJQ60_11380 [Arthrobacter sp.]|nr:hypothetical protein [Arthrobacter sp.]